MQKKFTMFALIAIVISSVVLFACPVTVKKYTAETKMEEKTDESAVSAWHFASTGFKL